MSLIILSSSNDYHAAAACWAMKEAGLPVTLWEGAGYQDARHATLEVSPEPRVYFGDQEITKRDVVWHRRPRPFSYHPEMASVDRNFVRPQAIRFAENINTLLEKIGCRCVNPSEGAHTIAIKVNQLLLAVKCGFHVPRTMMGNDGPALAHWREKGKEHIYKAFHPHVWASQDTGRKAFAQTVKLPDVTPDVYQQISFTPGIYQELVKKAFDVRMLVMGNIVKAFRISSSELDWRLDLGSGLAEIKEITVPDKVLHRTRLFMAESAVVSGSFDFAVDFDENWWFLEINETGQFLWIDQVLPEAGLLQEFLSFLTGHESSRFPALRDFVFELTESGLDQASSSVLTLEA